MYEILLDGKTLYYPGDSISAVTEAKITEMLNDSGYMDITVPPTNPLYECIYERKSVVTVKKDVSVVWEGEVIDISETIRKEQKIYAAGIVSYLNDSLQEKREFLNKTPVQILGELINEHNRQVESKKHFTVGVVTIDVPEGTMNLTTNYESTLTVIREKICTEYNGYIRIRWVNGVRYLDVVKIEDYGNTCLQPIQFGRNLLDYAKNLSASNVVTCIVPLGAESEDGTFLTVNSANNGLSYIFNQEAVNSFGWIRKAVKFSDITDAQTLLEEGDKWLAQNQYAKLTIEVNAVDLSLLKTNMDSFNLGDYVNAKARPFGLDAWYYIRKKVTDLLHPDKNTITIGNAVLKSYTQQVHQEVGNIEKEIPSATKILLAAKQNASNLIKSATTGYIVLNMDENGNPKELLVMDTPDIKTTKKLWRLNINGFGYSSTGYDGEYGTAITMDGSIVADFITAGTMYADRIKGGTLTLGGTDNKNGILSVLDKNGKEVGRWDNSGITLPPGTKIAWTQIDDAEEQVTTITQNTVTTEYVNALKIKAGSVDAENISGTTITGKTISGGSIKIGSYFSVDSYGNVEANSLKSTNATISGGKIADFTIDTYGIRYGKQSINSDDYGIYIGKDGINVGYGSAFKVTDQGDVEIGNIGGITLQSTAVISWNGGSSQLEDDGIYLGSDRSTHLKRGELKVGSSATYYTTIIQNQITFGSSSTAYIKKGDETLISITTSTVSLHNSAIIGGTSGKVGFFSNAGSTKKTVSVISSTSSATASTNATKINEVINALKAYNLM